MLCAVVLKAGSKGSPQGGSAGVEGVALDMHQVFSVVCYFVTELYSSLAQGDTRSFKNLFEY